MNRIIAVVMVLLLGGCASYSEKTYYTPTNDLSWIVGELGTLIRTHKWDSGSELTIYLRTIDGNADLLFFQHRYCSLRCPTQIECSVS